MLSTNQSSLPILHAYRHLYRALLHAVQYSAPARYVARNQLRDAFRRGQREQFNQQKISRTLEFLNAATRERGLEHRILKNLLHVAFWRAYNLERPRKLAKSNLLAAHLDKTARTHYEMTLAMLNDSMGLCLR